MPVLTIVPNMEGRGSHLADKKIHHVTAPVTVGCLPRGMQGGKPSVMMEAPLPDGTFAVIETSLELLLAAADALKARYGDPREPGWTPPAEPVRN